MSKILIVVEQDLFLANALNGKLQSAGFQTRLSTNAGVVLEQLKIFKPDLLILDLQLQSREPFKILREKSADSEIAGIPVLAISPAGDVDEIKQGLELGVKDYIVKSQFNAEELAGKVRMVLAAGGREVGDKIAGRKVMWIEDDQFLSDLIARKLSQHKCKLLFTRTGEEALKVLEKDQPDVILLDLLLPGISGFEVLEKIKSDPRLRRIPVIVLSNFSQNNEIERTKKMGAERFLTKATVVLDDIVKEIETVLRKN